MSVILLDKIRRINNLLHVKSNAEKVVFSDICKVLGEILHADVFVYSRKGKTLGIALREDMPFLSSLLRCNIGEMIDAQLNERLLNILSTKENISLPMIGFEEPEAGGMFAIASPIDIAGDRKSVV